MKSEESGLNAQDISLGEFIKLLVLKLDGKGVAMPFRNEEKWHTFFYGLKSNHDSKGRPTFLDGLFFDWDGPSPKCQDLSEYLQALHLNGFVSVANPRYDRLKVDDDVRNNADRFGLSVGDAALAEFLDGSVESARCAFA